jgi:hypothetical protein
MEPCNMPSSQLLWFEAGARQPKPQALLPDCRPVLSSSKLLLQTVLDHVQSTIAHANATVLQTCSA